MPSGKCRGIQENVNTVDNISIIVFLISVNLLSFMESLVCCWQLGEVLWLQWNEAAVLAV